ncbi:hypothetical protein [Streptomyces sp. NPDC001833]|uniref:hypothetical protein n=1 Tax=Streptomyces sp. NPDC001833 TaxID=3154658 RepID=UPI00332F01D0
MSAPASAKQTDRAGTHTGPEATGASMRARVGDEIVVRLLRQASGGRGPRTRRSGERRPS